MKTLLVVFFLVVVTPRPAEAQIYNCSGKWTNHPCSTEPTKILEESKERQNPEQKLREEKKSLFHELNMKAIRAKREYDLRIDLTEVQEFCSRDDVSLADCRSRMETMSNRIDRKISEVALKRQQDLQEESNRIQEERNQIEADGSNVTIVERNIIVVPQEHHHHHRHSSSMGSSGISVSAQGTVGGANVTVNAGSITHAGGSVVRAPKPTGEFSSPYNPRHAIPLR